MSKAKLLVVEDDPNLGDILKEYLEMKGYEPTLCRDGEEGWNKFKKDKYDLCLLDIMMPKVDGYEVCKYIKDKHTKIKVVFLTAKSKRQDVEKGLNLGADLYLTKPFGNKDLVSKVKNLLN